MAVVLIAEVLLRLGAWDKLVIHNSYLGHGVFRARAIDAIGPENINWIVVGNSVIDWGLNHKKLTRELRKKNINYARMSMGSAKFPAVQMVTDWSINHMPNLNGIIIGANSSGFGTYTIDTQLKISWPFLESFNAEKYQYNTTSSDLDLIFKRTALSIFTDDIKNQIFNLSMFKAKKPHDTFDPTAELNFNKRMVGDVCLYQLDTLEECVNTTKQLIKKNKLTAFEKSIVSRCPVNTSIKRIKNNNSGKKLNNRKINQFVKNWSTFLQHISSQVNTVKLVLLPEYPLLAYSSKPDNMNTVYDLIYKEIKDINNIEIIDLRLIATNHSEYKACEFFYDGLHLSQVAKKAITELILNDLN